MASAVAAFSRIACYGTLAAIELLGALGVAITLDETVWASAIVVFAWLALAALWAGPRRHVSFRPISLAAVGVAMITFTMMVDYERIIELTGLACLDGGGHLDASHHHYLRGWVALLRGDLAAARYESGRAIELAERMGTPFPIALAGLNVARALHGGGGCAAARGRFATSRGIAHAMSSHVLQYQAALITADFAITEGNLAACPMALREGFRIARVNGYRMVPSWDPDLVARLCEPALQHGIETEFVNALINTRSLAPAGAYPEPGKLRHRTRRRAASVGAGRRLAAPGADPCSRRPRGPGRQ